MQIENILKNIEKYDFAKLDKCFIKAHNTMIGLWSYWWLTLCKDGYIQDSGLEIKKDSGKKTHADLIFYDNQANYSGALEVENNPDCYDVDVENLIQHAKILKDLKFLILHIRVGVDKYGNLKNVKATEEAKSAIKKIIKNKSLPQFWIVVLSKWGINKQISNIFTDEKIWRERSYWGHEWLVFRKGTEVKKYHGQTDKAEKINYTD